LATTIHACPEAVKIPQLPDAPALDAPAVAASAQRAAHTVSLPATRFTV
jgi:hypothetical protein